MSTHTTDTTFPSPLQLGQDFPPAVSDVCHTVRTNSLWHDRGTQGDEALSFELLNTVGLINEILKKYSAAALVSGSETFAISRKYFNVFLVLF